LNKPSAIIAEHLVKQYSIGQQGDAYLALRDVMTKRTIGAAKQLLRGRAKSNGSGARRADKFHALDDISFTIAQGDAVGLIGRNGSGKSTLLKILSRITTPTSGRARIRGRLASLLEVGTGFHGELTGRENVLLNGAILGMKHQEIKARFDEIVAFAEVEQFLDTPVKRYSSGMFIRLAFAVAAHLDPDILLVDEVLAVGDAAFQKKCLAKLGQGGQEGQTIVFVSHNMNAVEQLCTSAILLDNGKLIEHSNDVAGCIRQYAARAGTDFSFHLWERKDGKYDGHPFNPSSVYIGDRDGHPVASPISASDDVWLHIEGDVDPSAASVRLGYTILTSDGILLYSSFHNDADSSEATRLNGGAIHLRTKIPPRLLNEGTYRIELSGSAHARPTLFQPRDGGPSISVTVGEDLYKTQFWMLKRPGLLAPEVHWESVSS
jgi:lipopolysaccharide transport system ATP-binding protein